MVLYIVMYMKDEANKNMLEVKIIQLDNINGAMSSIPEAASIVKLHTNLNIIKVNCKRFRLTYDSETLVFLLSRLNIQVQLNCNYSFYV